MKVSPAMTVLITEDTASVHQVYRSCWDRASLGRRNPTGHTVAGNTVFRRSYSREDMESLTGTGSMPVVDNMLEAGSNRTADNNRETAHNITVEQ
jgi:hypothetical protein